MKHRRLIFAAGLALGLVGAAAVGFDRWVNATVLPNLSLATSPVVTDRNGELLRAYTVAGGRWRLTATVADVDPSYLKYLIAYEDKRFYRHQGVDSLAILRAAGQAAWHGKVVSGGSTLTMQVARLLENSGTGRWGSKLRQARLALALERQLSKNDILNLYLKLAPFGGNLEGVRAASLSYFGKEPARLTTAQSALLVALPQSPESRRPDRHPAAARQGRNRIIDRLARADILSLDQAHAAQSELMPSRRRDFPVIAAHMADRLVAADPFSPNHRLTLDRRLQISLESLARSAAQAKDPNISAAILVLDHQSGEILASVGSAGFLDHDRQGFIDMTRATRSPGSTLKPLIYGLAFDGGLAHPETLMLDQPTAFGTYAPQNFDKQFYGQLPARQALQLSLNIPAVALLQAVGPAQLIDRMKRANVTARLPENAPPGLAIALGGLGLTLTDLVTLYAAIANGGQPVSPFEIQQPRARAFGAVPRGEDKNNNFTASLATVQSAVPRTSKPADPASAVMSPESAWHIADILTGVRGPDTAPKNNLAYKTGTSYGYRDAWAIGFDGRHVIGVWMGRPDGGSLPGLLGADLAAPVLFAAFERLKPVLTPLRPPPPSTLMVDNADLPQPLKRFRGLNAVFDIDLNPPEIAFPPDGARLELGLSGPQNAGAQQVPLVLKVRNGTPPFTWIADGVPFLIGDRSRQAQLVPLGPGYLDISVIDATGQSQHSRVELR